MDVENRLEKGGYGMKVLLQLTDCGCPHGGLGSIRVYRGPFMIRKEIVDDIKDYVEVMEHVKGSKYLIKIRKRISDDAFMYLWNYLKEKGAEIEVEINEWGIDIPGCQQAS